jgi:hypothetical protein
MPVKRVLTESEKQGGSNTIEVGIHHVNQRPLWIPKILSLALPDATLTFKVPICD